MGMIRRRSADGHSLFSTSPIFNGCIRSYYQDEKVVQRGVYRFYSPQIYSHSKPHQNKSKMSDGSGPSAGLLRDMLQRIAVDPKFDVGTVVVGLVFLFIIHSFRVWYRLSHVPGPFLAGFSRFWMLRGSMRAQQPMEIQAAVEKYGEKKYIHLLALVVVAELHAGSLVRIGPNELATDDASLIKRINSGRSAYTRGPCRRTH